MQTRLLHKDLISITLSRMLAGFGGGLVGVFIPLLLLNKGLLLWQVCAFYAGYAIIKLLINYSVVRAINRFGARLGLICGYSSKTFFMVLLTLYIVSGIIWLLPIMALAMALQNAFLWSSEHLHISRVMDETRKGRDMAMMASLNRIIGIITPFIGGLIAVSLGQFWLVVIAAIAVSLAIVPVWHIDKLGGGHKQTDNIKYSLKSAPTRDVIANFGFNAHAAVGIMVWPIYLAVFIPDFHSIGIISTVAAILAIVVLQFAGSRGDKGKAHAVLTEGTALSSVVHIIRIFATNNPFIITFISALYDIALDYQFNPWVSLYYSHTRQKGMNYILSMEIAGDVAYVTLWGTLGIVSYLSGNNLFFAVAFTGAAMLTWLCLLITPENKKDLQIQES